MADQIFTTSISILLGFEAFLNYVKAQCVSIFPCLSLVLLSSSGAWENGLIQAT